MVKGGVTVPACIEDMLGFIKRHTRIHSRHVQVLKEKSTHMHMVDMLGFIKIGLPACIVDILGFIKRGLIASCGTHARVLKRGLPECMVDILGSINGIV